MVGDLGEHTALSPPGLYSSGDSFVFRPGSGTNWPYLIRIRYRIHDVGNRVADTSGVPGRVFEHIMSVNR